MATLPVYAATTLLGSTLVPGTADTSWTAPTNVATLVTAGASGSKISQVDVIPAGTVVAGLVNVFMYDGSAYHLLASVQISAYTSSTTAPPTATTLTFDNLVLPNGWSLRVTNTVAGNVSLVNVNAFGGSY